MTRFISLASTNGPFFSRLLLIYCFRASVTMNLSVALRRRVFLPMATLPHLVCGWPPIGRLALATTVRMVARVHRRAAHRRANAHVPRAAGLADRDRGVLGVAHLAERGHALDEHAAHLARRQAHLGPVAFLGHQLRADARAAHHLAAAAGLQLDVVDDRADRDVAQGQRIARRELRLGAGAQPRADAHADRRNDVAPLAVLVLEQRDARRAVRVVLDGDDLAGMPILLRFQSMIRYRRLWPPPRWRVVMRPLLLRPAVFFSGSVSDRSGLVLVISSKVATDMPRRPGEVGL